LPNGSHRPSPANRKEITGCIGTFAAIGVHDLIFGFCGQSAAQTVEPAKLRRGGHSVGEMTTVWVAVMVGSGAQSPSEEPTWFVYQNRPSIRQDESSPFIQPT